LIWKIYSKDARSKELAGLNLMIYKHKNPHRNMYRNRKLWVWMDTRYKY